jgi:hypothetical protein
MPSSVIADMRYLPEKRTLRILFVSGASYDYFNVPPKVFEEMKASTSKGFYLNKYIKGRFKYKKTA